MRDDGELMKRLRALQPEPATAVTLAFVESPSDRDSASLATGLESLGVKVHRGPADWEQVGRTTLVAGGIRTISAGIMEGAIPPRPWTDYPNHDHPDWRDRYYRRKIWGTTWAGAARAKQDVFLKMQGNKSFIPAVHAFSRGIDRDLAWNEVHADTYTLWASEPLEIRSEWRAFVVDGVAADVRPYAGTWREPPSPDVVDSVVADMAQCGLDNFAVDFAVTPRGTVIVEVNDGASLGSYGLDPQTYARLIINNWLARDWPQRS